VSITLIYYFHPHVFELGDIEEKKNTCLSVASFRIFLIHRGADKSSDFLISYFPIGIKTKRIFLGWVKEVRTSVCGAHGEGKGKVVPVLN
jgi:hypothetical protein